MPPLHLVVPGLMLGQRQLVPGEHEEVAAQLPDVLPVLVLDPAVPEEAGPVVLLVDVLGEVALPLGVRPQHPVHLEGLVLVQEDVLLQLIEPERALHVLAFGAGAERADVGAPVQTAEPELGRSVLLALGVLGRVGRGVGTTVEFPSASVLAQGGRGGQALARGPGAAENGDPLDHGPQLGEQGHVGASEVGWIG